MIEEDGAIDQSSIVSESPEGKRDGQLQRTLHTSVIRVDLRLVAVSRGQAIKSEYKSS